jgi:O-antigen/teichoic acid export membrane protein
MVQPMQTALPDHDRLFRTDHLKSDLAARSVRGGAVTLAAQGLRFAIQIGSTMVLARLLVPGDFGLIGMAVAVTGFIALFRDLGLSQATIQRDQITQADVNALFWVNVAVSTALALLTLGLAPLLAWFYGDSRVSGITMALGVGFLFGGIAAQHQALIDRQMRFTARGAVDVASLAAGAVAGIAAALLGAGYWSLVIQALTMSFASAVGYWRLSRWRPNRPAWSPGARSMLHFGGHLTGYQVVNYFGRNVDNLLIGRVWGAGPLGLYSRAYQLLMLPIRQVNAPLASVAMPALGRLRAEPERYRAVYLRVLEKIGLITMPGVAFLIGTSDWVIRVALGPGWEGAAAIFTWLGVAALVQPAANTTGWLFVSQERGGDLFRWGLIGMVITVGAIVAGLPWGVVGVAAVYAISDIGLKTPLLFWYVGRSGPVRTGDFYRALAAPALATAATLASILLIREFAGITNPIQGLLITGAAGLVAGFTALLITPLGRSALRDFRRMGALLNTRSLPT